MGIVFSGDLVQRVGPVLFWAGMVYSVIALMVSLAVASGGGSLHVSLVPGVVASIYAETFRAWSSLSGSLGKPVSVTNLPLVLWDLSKAVIGASLSIMGLLATATIAFLLIAVQLSHLIPPPFTFLTIVLWIVLGFAEVILIQYLIGKIVPLVTEFVNTAMGILRPRI